MLIALIIINGKKKKERKILKNFLPYSQTKEAEYEF